MPQVLFQQIAHQNTLGHVNAIGFSYQHFLLIGILSLCSCFTLCRNRIIADNESSSQYDDDDWQSTIVPFNWLCAEGTTATWLPGGGLVRRKRKLGAEPPPLHLPIPQDHHKYTRQTRRRLTKVVVVGGGDGERRCWRQAFVWFEDPIGSGRIKVCRVFWAFIRLLLHLLSSKFIHERRTRDVCGGDWNRCQVRLNLLWRWWQDVEKKKQHLS